jgi:sulfatase maturation enzyme AslB (radical SAM superfamily)
MSLKEYFCPSPWFHMRINNAGHYEYCRWASKANRFDKESIQTTTPIEFFQKHMTPIRTAMRQGQAVAGCAECYEMEQYNKVSGRERQLLKIGVRTDQFVKTMASSPWLPEFASDQFTQSPQDWQIDLGNYCNSACVFCNPSSSSRLATEWKKIGIATAESKTNWADDPALVAKLVSTLEQSLNIQYIHFIGGETLITPAFKTILQALIRSGLNRTATIGFTTNLITWDNDVVDLLTQFNGVNLGMSVESFTPVNDYVRWPASTSVVQDKLTRWLELAKQHNWFVQFRITPTVLSVQDLLSVHDYAWQQGIAVESCNFLTNPSFMKSSVLPMQYRQPIIDRMKSWIDRHHKSSNTVVNTRNPDFAQDQIVQDLESYVNYLLTAPDESHLMPELVNYLKRLEHNRGNSILTYLPEYEELFRTAGY